jgi:hypothetical protein
MTIKEICDEYRINQGDIRVPGEISVGYHTFNSLYKQRLFLSAALCNTFKDLAWKSHLHSDGEACFGGGWFIVGIHTPEGDYTYHYEDEYWDMFKVQELDNAPEWDGHTDADVERVLSVTLPTVETNTDAPKEEKSEGQSWAEREVELACKRERKAAGKTNDWDYGCACYKSALKAYNSLCKDGHSGFSIGLTQNILNRLIDHKPLTPIEDKRGRWRPVNMGNNRKTYQHKRYSALFKTIHPDKTVTYSDVDACYCVDANNEGGASYTSGLVRRVIDEMYPITMPYMPGKPIKVFCSECLTDAKNGDYDTVAILYCVKGDEKVDIHRYFKEDGHDFVEIDRAEYEDRVIMDARRKNIQSKNS